MLCALPPDGRPRSSVTVRLNLDAKGELGVGYYSAASSSFPHLLSYHVVIP